MELAEHADLASARAHAEARARTGSSVVVEERVGVRLTGRWEYTSTA